MVPKPDTTRGVHPLWMIGVAGLVACGGGTSGYSSSPDSPPAPAPAACSPAPCAIDSDMTLYVDKVEKSIPPGSHTSDAGQHVARLTVRWAYNGTDTQHANPLGLNLTGPDHITGNRIDVGQFLIPGCDSGKAPEMAAGAVYGPVTVCFDVGGDPAGPLVLVYKEWLLSGGQKIALP